jgi:hypothetical protein
LSPERQRQTDDDAARAVARRSSSGPRPIHLFAKRSSAARSQRNAPEIDGRSVNELVGAPELVVVVGVLLGVAWTTWPICRRRGSVGCRAATGRADRAARAVRFSDEAPGGDD